MRKPTSVQEKKKKKVQRHREKQKCHNGKVRERVKEEKVGGGILVPLSFKEFPFLKDHLSDSLFQPVEI